MQLVFCLQAALRYTAAGAKPENEGKTMKGLTLLVCLVAVLGLASACVAEERQAAANASSATLKTAIETQAPFSTKALQTFHQPWAMAVLPDHKLLVSEKSGKLWCADLRTVLKHEITGMPAVVDAGQGGLGDLALHPDFARNQWLYFSYVEAGEPHLQGAVVARARLDWSADGGKLSDVQVIWRQVPKVTGDGHYGHRLLFGADGKLWVSSSERQKFTPAQDMNSNLGKIVRLNDDGSVPTDNPFADQGGVAAQVWSLGHRNVLGMAFDQQGRLWANEMGPKGGDELNLIEKGGNYGYPIVSNGDHYSGRVIPDHNTRPEFIAPKISWTPVISPSSMVFYTGQQFPSWQGQLLIGGLSSKSLLKIAIHEGEAEEVARYDMGERIRAVAQGQEGEVWLLEDGNTGRLLQLQPQAPR